jgi:hypothetical protein
MINLYSEIVDYDGVNFQNHLERIGAMIVFEPIIKEYEDNLLQVKVAKYIAFTHSIESPKLSVGGDRRKEVAAVFKELSIEDEYYQDLILLKNKNVLKSVQLWMEKKDNRQFEYLLTLQNAYVQQQTASLDMLRKGDTLNIDYDQKFKCIEYMTDLKKMIKDAESELQQNDPKLKEAQKEVRKATKFVLGPENFAV